MKQIFAAILVLLVTLSAVAVAVRPERVQDGRVVLTYSCPEFWAKVEQVGLFNRLQSRCRVQIDPNNGGVQKTIVQSLAGVGPDMFNSYQTMQASTYVQVGITWDITDSMKEAGIDVERITWPSAHPDIIRDGRVHGFPYGGYIDALYYNKDIFDRYGVPYPKGILTRDRFIEIAKRLTVRDKDGRPVVFGFMLRWHQIFYDLMLQWGGRMYTRDGTRCVVDSPQNVEALQFMTDLIFKHGVMPSPEQEAGMATEGGWGSGVITWFGAGRSAMAMAGRQSLVAYRNKDEFAGLRLGVVPYRFGPKLAYIGYTGTVMINKHSPRRELALEYLKYMATKQYNDLVNNQADGLCPVKSFAYTDAFLINPKHPEEDFNEVWRFVMENAQPAQTSPFVSGAEESRVLRKQLDLVRAGVKSPAVALRSAARDINEAIAAAVERDGRLRERYRRLTGGRP